MSPIVTLVTATYQQNTQTGGGEIRKVKQHKIGQRLNSHWTCVRKTSEEKKPDSGEPMKQKDVAINGEIDGKVTVFSER